MPSLLSRLFVVGALAFVLAGCGQSQPEMRAVRAGGVILAFGDSLTFGTGARENESYPAVLAGLTGRTVVRSGIPGEVSADGLARLEKVLEEHTPALVLLCHGGNDLLRKKPLAGAEANLREMIRMIRATGAQVVLLGVPKPALILSPAEFYDRIAEEMAVPYLRDSLSDILGDASLKADAAHPNAAGYDRLARDMHELLKEAGAL